MNNTPLVQKSSPTFIPKSKQTPARRRRYYNIFFGFSVTILFLVLLFWGALFIYNRTLVTEKSQVEAQLKTLTGDIISEELIQDFQKLELQLTTAEKLLDQHINAAPFISLLEDLTLTNSIRFSNLSIASSEGVYTVSMSGTARNFESLGYQERLFSEEPTFSNVVFNDFAIDEETGFIGFGTTFVVSQELLSYKKQKGVGQEAEASEDVNNSNE